MLTRPMHNDMPLMGTALQPAMLDQRGRQRRRRGWQRRILRGAIGIFGLLTLWAAMSEYYGLALILPPPWTVFHDIFDTLTLDYRSPWMYGPNIYQHLAASFARAIVGFTLAAAAAIPCGLLVGRSRAMREFLEPVIKLLYPIPGIAWIPLAILWFGLTDKAVIFVVFIAEFFPLFFNTEAGARAINPLIVDAARCYGARGFTLVWRVILPASIPYIITGMRIGLGGAWRMIVAAEMLAAKTGVGFLLMQARFQFRASDLMMAMILISVVGYATERLLVRTLERRTVAKWEVNLA
ncbi:MAG TPA: ABC transporter permease [Acetobacteraceae bacterium]|jgi:ABC-type nitrate/sulfonate/bicarbonate transport system permease component|nr:ABC transporter permease [Acetobacteraceae bacterium]